MITVEDLLMAYASAYDAWLDPETDRKNPTPEYAELIRLAVDAENAKLRELVVDLWMQLLNAYDRKEVDEFADRMRELGIEVEECTTR